MERYILMNNPWYKEWDRIGLTKDENFMFHDKCEIYNNSRNKIVNFINEHKIQSIADIGCGPGIDVELIVNSNCNTLKLYHAYDVNEYVRWGKLQFPKWVTLFKTDNPYLINTNDRIYECVYTRHTLEHQEISDIFIKELCRISKKFIVIVFFIIPVNMLSDYVDNKWDNNFYCKTYSINYIIEKFKSYHFEVFKIDEYVVNEKSETNQMWQFKLV
jgi:ubiquinone/menaquinone biosynthesis C-methylase UbiE